MNPFSTASPLLAALVAGMVMTSLPGVAGIDFSHSTGNEAFEDASGSRLPYRLFKPIDYCADISPLFRPAGCDPTLTFPLIVFFHGAGERGSDNKLQATGGGHLENLYEAARGESFDKRLQAFLLAPQCPTNQRWVEFDWSKGAYGNDLEPPVSEPMDLALQLVEAVIEDYEIERDRVYVTGLSMGGYATWDAIRRRPELFAAALPLSGGGNRDHGATMKETPIWAYHGSLDGVVPPSGTDAMQEAIIAAGGTMHYSRPEEGHAGWGTFYDNQTYQNSDGETVLDWLYAQRLPPGNVDSDYDGWAAGFPDLADQGQEADPDRDGRPNLDEYLFGLDPSDPTDAHPIQWITRSAQTVLLEYTRRDPSLSGRQPRITTSTDLVTWSSAIPSEETASEADLSTGIQTVRATIDLPLGTGTSYYLRIEFPDL